jgi:hypothetical protein
MACTEKGIYWEFPLEHAVRPDRFRVMAKLRVARSAIWVEHPMEGAGQLASLPTPK